MSKIHFKTWYNEVEFYISMSHTEYSTECFPNDFLYNNLTYLQNIAIILKNRKYNAIYAWPSKVNINCFVSNKVHLRTVQGLLTKTF